MRVVAITPELEQALNLHLQEARKIRKNSFIKGRITYDLRVEPDFVVRIGNVFRFSLDRTYYCEQFGYENLGELEEAAMLYFEKNGVKRSPPVNVLRKRVLWNDPNREFNEDYQARITAPKRMSN